MSDEPLAVSSLVPTSRRSETEYEAICAAFMETMRGRWFLAEYARRNRNSDTKLVLAAIERIEAAMQAGNTNPSLQRLRSELAQMQRAIASTKLDLAAIESDLQYQTANGTATSARAAATSDRKSTRLNSSHIQKSRMPSSA